MNALKVVIIVFKTNMNIMENVMKIAKKEYWHITILKTKHANVN